MRLRVAIPPTVPPPPAPKPTQPQTQASSSSSSTASNLWLVNPHHDDHNNHDHNHNNNNNNNNNHMHNRSLLLSTDIPTVASTGIRASQRDSSQRPSAGGADVDGFPVEDPNHATGGTGTARHPGRATHLNMYPCQYIICELQIHLAEMYTFSQSITFRLDLDNKLSSAFVEGQGQGLAHDLGQELGQGLGQGLAPGLASGQGLNQGLAPGQGLGPETSLKIESEGIEMTSNTIVMYEKFRPYFMSAQNNARKIHRRMRTMNKINQTFSAPNELELFMEVISVN